MDFFKLTNNTLPTKEQLDKLSKDIEHYEYMNNKNDCEYMMKLITKTLSQATKSSPTKIYETADIDIKQLSLSLNTGLKKCTGTIVNPYEELDKIGVKLTVENSSYTYPHITYNKSNKTMRIHPSK